MSQMMSPTTRPFYELDPTPRKGSSCLWKALKITGYISVGLFGVCAAIVVIWAIGFGAMKLSKYPTSTPGELYFETWLFGIFIVVVGAGLLVTGFMCFELIQYCASQMCCNSSSSAKPPPPATVKKSHSGRILEIRQLEP
jgi:hypothetical protein